MVLGGCMDFNGSDSSWLDLVGNGRGGWTCVEIVDGGYT